MGSGIRFMQLGTLARRLSFLTMSNSAVFFVPAAHWCARVWSFPVRVHPEGGVGGAPTGALVLLSRLRDATDPRE